MENQFKSTYSKIKIDDSRRTEITKMPFGSVLRWQ